MTIPRATYRLQFREGMDFDRAAELVPYLKKLGISHLYASPIFSATTGSTHGYDVTDHNEIEPSIGGRAGLDRLSAALKKHGLGLILDIVPNHMAASLQNPWWASVVEWGEASPFARHFDIDWREPLTLPILGKTFAEAAGDGELSVVLDRDNGRLALAYFETNFPLMPASYGAVLNDCEGELAEKLRRSGSTAQASEEFHNEVKRLARDDESTSALEAALKRRASDRDFLTTVHEAQPWRLTFWKDARKHLSYRRFFEVTGLVGVRVEDEQVFDDVHRAILDLVHTGVADGLRIDHVDGLADPKSYLERLREKVGPDVPIHVEKILEGDERLPGDWPIEGTTGYEFIAAMSELFVDADGLAKLDRAYQRFIGRPVDLETERRAAKRLMVAENFETEMNGLVKLAAAVQSTGALIPDEEWRAAIGALIVAFPVYRTYGTAAGMPDRDRQLLQDVAEGMDGSDIDRAAVDHVVGLLCEPERAPEFVTRFQQLTGPVTAKAVEDTLFYRYNRLIAQNEVGCDPGLMLGVDKFHERMGAQAKWPHALLATSTHDTKRGEDARTRLYALSHLPAPWIEAVARWHAMNGGDGIDADTEWLIYQALLGVWPAGIDGQNRQSVDAVEERFLAYLEKAMREAKLHTLWTEPNDEFESGINAFAKRLFASREFLGDFIAVAGPFIEDGAAVSFAQTAIKLTAPGIPDIYQGAEGIDLSLVDPDNRRVPDFNRLARADFGAPLDLSADAMLEGTAKQHLIHRCLELRSRDPELFELGAYTPLEIVGSSSDEAAAFARSHGNRALIVIVARSTRSIQNQLEARLDLPDTLLDRTFVDVLSGVQIAGSSLQNLTGALGGRPAALLLAKS